MVIIMVYNIVINCVYMTGTMEFYDFPIILGMSSSQLTFTPSFFRGVGLNHQPESNVKQFVINHPEYGHTIVNQGPFYEKLSCCFHPTNHSLCHKNKGGGKKIEPSQQNRGIPYTPMLISLPNGSDGLDMCTLAISGRIGDVLSLRHY